MVRDVMCCALVEVEWRARITANVTPYQVVINSCSIIIHCTPYIFTWFLLG